LANQREISLETLPPPRIATLIELNMTISRISSVVSAILIAASAWPGDPSFLYAISLGFGILFLVCAHIFRTSCDRYFVGIADTVLVVVLIWFLVVVFYPMNV
jgi:hypothetical protein